MTFSIYLPWLCSVVLAAAAPVIVRRLAPRAAVWSLVTAAAACAAGTTWSLVLMAATLLGRTAEVEAAARARGVDLAEPVPRLLAGGAALLIGLAVWRLAQVIATRTAVRTELRRLCEGHGAELVIVDLELAHAFAVPGPEPHIVATRSMLKALTAAERRVLLEHERAHLRFGHHRFEAAVAVAVAVNPLLAPVRNAVAFLLERWADETAASEVGSRRLALRSLARAAQAATATSRSGVRLAFAELGVIHRLEALRVSPPRAARIPALAAALLCLVVGLATADATWDFVGLVSWLVPF
ncbi:M48 family metalloprotease [Actinocorallia longicatena]|uniref:M56 family metallopeptidase n=1 Tax=Actinocorallia longicatena TaxID=111803 RepID=A0ABP6PWI4_9ACTN